MAGVLLGFGVVLMLIAIGLLSVALLPYATSSQISAGLTPAIYYITNPALIFTLVAETDLREVISLYAPVALITAIVAGAIAIFGLKVFFNQSLSEATPSAMAASYVNAGNIGLPIALFAVGSTLPVVGVLVIQLLLLAPIYLAAFSVLSKFRAQQTHAWRTVVGAAANPVTVAALIGAVFSLFDWKLPEIIWTPVDMLGQASVPLLLMLFGMSVYVQTSMRRVKRLPELLWLLIIKLVFMPTVAWLLGAYVFGLDGKELFGAVAMAALPSAQNVFLFARHFSMSTSIVRDVILASSILSLPVIMSITFILVP